MQHLIADATFAQSHGQRDGAPVFVDVLRKNVFSRPSWLLDVSGRPAAQPQEQLASARCRDILYLHKIA